MTKKAIIIRSIVAGILIALSVFFVWCIVDCIHSILNVDWGGLAIIALIAYFIYAIPVFLFVVIYQIVMLVKRKFFIFDFIASIIFVLSWLSLYLVPLIVA